MRRYKHKKPKTIGVFFIFVFIVLFVILGFLIFKVFALEKFVYVNNNNGNAEIIVVDPQRETTSKILIDKDFKLESSRNFGEYKLSSLWILGEKEKYQGKLVSETLVKNFLVPIYLWKDGRFSNLNLYQKIKIYWLKNRSNEYDYQITSKNLSSSILVNFVLSNAFVKLPKAEIEDLTGEKAIAEKISKVLEVLGFKTVDYSKGYDEQLDCEVVGKDKSYVDVIVNIFDCKGIINKDQSIDLKIRIGKVFADRF